MNFNNQTIISGVLSYLEQEGKESLTEEQIDLISDLLKGKDSLPIRSFIVKHGEVLIVANSIELSLLLYHINVANSPNFVGEKPQLVQV